MNLRWEKDENRMDGGWAGEEAVKWEMLWGIQGRGKGKYWGRGKLISQVIAGSHLFCSIPFKKQFVTWLVLVAR